MAEEEMGFDPTIKKKKKKKVVNVDGAENAADENAAPAAAEEGDAAKAEGDENLADLLKMKKKEED